MSLSTWFNFMLFYLLISLIFFLLSNPENIYKKNCNQNAIRLQNQQNVKTNSKFSLSCIMCVYCAKTTTTTTTYNKTRYIVNILLCNQQHTLSTTTTIYLYIYILTHIIRFEDIILLTSTHSKLIHQTCLATPRRNPFTLISVLVSKLLERLHTQWTTYPTVLRTHSHNQKHTHATPKFIIIFT